MPDSRTITDAFRMAEKRGELSTSLGTAELRELGAGVLRNAAFTARGTNATFTSMIKQVVDELAAGNIDEATARVTLLETLRALGYTPEGGFPDAPAGSVPPALKGTLQDLSSFRRLKLIVETQRQLMQGAGLQFRGHDADRLSQFPAWELVRVYSVAVPRDWQSRWQIAGGKFYDGRMVALKGDPVWGELGSYDNFSDALGTDHPPFAFNSGMGWRELSNSECQTLNLTGPNGESIAEFLSGVERPRVMAGELPLPTPKLSIQDMDPALLDELIQATGATVADGAATLSYDAESIAQRAIEREQRGAERLAKAIARRKEEYARRGA